MATLLLISAPLGSPPPHEAPPGVWTLLTGALAQRLGPGVTFLAATVEAAPSLADPLAWRLDGVIAERKAMLEAEQEENRRRAAECRTRGRHTYQEVYVQGQKDPIALVCGPCGRRCKVVPA